MKAPSNQSPDRAPPALDLSPAAMGLYMRRARCLRAAAFSRALKGLVRGAASLLRNLEESRERRRAIAELNRLDGRLLRDIGIERSQIPYVVEQLQARRKADGDPKKVYPLRALSGAKPRRAGDEDDGRCPPLAA